MALLDVLLLVLAVMMARAAWRVIDGVMEGVSGRSPRASDRNVPARGVQMARDPVCGTYVIPDRAIALSDGTGRVFFCSASCRDKYRLRSATDRHPPVEGRTA
jgi:YHS domain-containing protein